MNKNTEPKKILIVEDEPDICLLLNIMLEDGKTELTHVKSIEQAKAFLNGSNPDLIVLDNKLPDGMGVDFIKDIKFHSPETKILMISGSGAEVSDVALENGANKFLTKPFNKNELKESVHHLMEIAE